VRFQTTSEVVYRVNRSQEERDRVPGNLFCEVGCCLIPNLVLVLATA